MTWLFLLACISLIEIEPPVGAQSVNPNPPQAQPAAPIDIVAALETVVADAIARAEPSVVAIHRVKGENPQETLAVRGKSRPQLFDPRVPRPGFLGTASLPTRSPSTSDRGLSSAPRDRS